MSSARMSSSHGIRLPGTPSRVLAKTAGCCHWHGPVWGANAVSTHRGGEVTANRLAGEGQELVEVESIGASHAAVTTGRSGRRRHLCHNKDRPWRRGIFLYTTRCCSTGMKSPVPDEQNCCRLANLLDD
jgi:hypothetical protein